jgi:hypothetical protein
MIVTIMWDEDIADFLIEAGLFSKALIEGENLFESYITLYNELSLLSRAIEHRKKS